MFENDQNREKIQEILKPLEALNSSGEYLYQCKAMLEFDRHLKSVTNQIECLSTQLTSLEIEIEKHQINL